MVHSEVPKPKASMRLVYLPTFTFEKNNHRVKIPVSWMVWETIPRTVRRLDINNAANPLNLPKDKGGKHSLTIISTSVLCHDQDKRMGRFLGKDSVHKSAKSMTACIAFGKCQDPQNKTKKHIGIMNDISIMKFSRKTIPYRHPFIVSVIGVSNHL